MIGAHKGRGRSSSTWLDGRIPSESTVMVQLYIVHSTLGFELRRQLQHGFCWKERSAGSNFSVGPRDHENEAPFLYVEKKENASSHPPILRCDASKAK